VGRGDRRNGLRLGRLIMPVVGAGGHEGDEGHVKPGGLQEYADLALNPEGLLGRVWLTKEAPRLEAVLAKSRRTEF